MAGVDEHAAALAQAVLDRSFCERAIIAIAGPPASGKTTLAARLAERLNGSSLGSAVALGQDGFHYDDAVLNPRGWRARKGAPHTFDVGGLRALLERLRLNKEDEIAAPVFDRTIEIARAGALIIPQSARFVVLEGNYLLFKQAPWPSLRPLFDLTVRLDVPEPVLRERLLQRWAEIGLDAEATARKLEDNDLPNALAVIQESGEADMRVENL